MGRGVEGWHKRVTEPLYRSLGVEEFTLDLYGGEASAGVPLGCSAPCMSSVLGTEKEMPRGAALVSSLLKSFWS